jgi:putative SOS response-associated peptidase YedK
MCFHTSQIQPVQKLEEHYQVRLNEESQRDLYNQPRYHINGFTHAQLLIIPQEKPKTLTSATWGIAPENKKVEDLKAYYKEAVKFGGGLNARSEKAFAHFLYKKSIFTKRCIVPVSAFFEPHEHQKKKYPFVFKPKDNPILSLAGIYTRIENVVSFSILTQEASPLFARIHNQKKRQPILLNNELCRKWLRSDLPQDEIKSILVSKYEDAKLEYHAVSKDLFQPKVNSDVSTILEKVDYEELSV